MNYFTMLILLYTSSVFAGNSCVEENVYMYKSIDCCISSELTVSLCEEKINQLSPKLLNLISDTKQLILNKNYKPMSAPNCFWFSLAYKDNSLKLDTKIVNEAVFLKSITGKYKEKSLFDLEASDILYYEGEYEFIHDFLNDGVPITVSVPFHAGIYVGDNLILQKENSTDSIFSLVPIKDSFRGYSGAFKNMNQGILKLKVLGADK